MTTTIYAVFEGGQFRPVESDAMAFAEGTRVRLTVDDTPLQSDEILQLATKVYDGLSEQEIDEIEEIATNRSNFFTK